MMSLSSGRGCRGSYAAIPGGDGATADWIVGEDGHRTERSLPRS
jgi:hypothetical protein